MAALLSKFRIDYSDVIVVPDVGKRAKDETKEEFKAMIEKYKNPKDGSSKLTHFLYNSYKGYEMWNAEDSYNK